jgi:enoyl-CoA hydratase
VALLAADLRIGAAGDWKIGLNEVAIGLTLPTFATVLAEERLSVRHRQRAQALAEVYDGDGAVDAGFLDRVVPAADVERVAVAEAARLAESLHLGAHRATKLRVRRAALAALRESFEEDLASTVAS